MQGKIFIVDDHPVVRRGYASIISRESDLEVCGEASSGQEALEKIPETHPDLILADILMEGMSGIELIKHVEAQEFDMPVLVISMHDESLYAERALEAGAMGYIMKDEVDTVIIDAIHTILQGGLYVSEQMNAKMLMRSVGRSVDNESSLAQLSDRELEVFEHLGRGLTTSEIADAMFISPKTVGTHRRQIQEKLNITTTAKLRQRAVLWTHRGEAS